ncbi:MAG TPA: hypothetical protein VFR28_01015 [Allosphingosinicella sp.]|jgi:hypothetical protein|nr:hypothetical protein [Allosphingosinicella sp.]
MSGDRLALILAKQKQAHDQRTAELEEQRRRELEKERRVQKLLEAWSHSQATLKAVVAELNQAMKANGVVLRHREETSLAGLRRSAEITYDQPQEYISMGLSLRLYLSSQGLLTVAIVGLGRPIKNEKIKLTDFVEEVQRAWLLDFLEATADAEAGER